MATFAQRRAHGLDGRDIDAITLQNHAQQWLLDVLGAGHAHAGAFEGAETAETATTGGKQRAFSSALANGQVLCHLINRLHDVPYWVKLTATFVMILGFIAAWLAYIRRPDLPAQTAQQLGPVYRLFYNKWYFDEIYNFLFVRPAFWLGRKFWKLGDVGTIDRFGPDGAAWVISKGSVAAKKLQSGYLNTYALVMLLGVVAAIMRHVTAVAEYPREGNMYLAEVELSSFTEQRLARKSNAN